MKTLAKLIAFFLAVALYAQTSATVTAGSKKWTFTLPAVAVSTLTCDKTAFANHGDSSICTVTLTGPAPTGGFLVSPYSADPPLTVNPTGVLFIAAGQSSIQFTVTYP